MTSEEYADEVTVVVESLRGRIMGVGAAQYDDGSGVQKFERKSAAWVAEEAIEEIDDLVAYLVQIRIKIKEFATRLPLI